MLGSCSVVTKIHLTGVNCIVSNYSNRIERPLNTNVEATLHERSNISVEIIARQTEVLTKLLNCYSQERRCPPG